MHHQIARLTPLYMEMARLRNIPNKIIRHDIIQLVFLLRELHANISVTLEMCCLEEHMPLSLRGSRRLRRDGPCPSVPVCDSWSWW
jgi:hypothetical protein